MQGFAVRRLRQIVLPLTLAACLAACGGKAEKDAAEGVVIFLNAARADNREVFEARVDRRATRNDLQAQFAKLPGVREMQAQLGETVGEGALDRLISPDTVRRLEKAPEGATTSTLTDVRPRLHAKADGRVCLRDPEIKNRCLMTFAKEDNLWKLVGLYAEPQSFDPVSLGAEPAVSAQGAGSEPE